jgi:NAD(P)H-dependent flavin oxidoreductase YrpB (nitropropane dioxygenase family)
VLGSPIHDRIKEKIVEATEQDTIHLFRTMHNTLRVFKNKVSEEVVAIEQRPGSKFEDVRELVSGVRGRKVYELGDPEYGIWSMGLAAGLVHDIPKCEDLVRRMESEAEEMMGGMSRILKAKL